MEVETMPSGSKLTIAALLTLVIIVSVIAVFFATQQSEEETTAAHMDYQTGWIFSVQESYLYRALDTGLFEEAGVDLNLVPGAEATTTVVSLAQGQIDFLHMASSELIAARAAGLPIVAIAVKEQMNPAVLIALAESGITTPQDLVGKTVAIEVGGESEFLLRDVLKKELTPEQASTVKIVPRSFSFAPLAEGQIDVHSTWESAALHWEKEFNVKFNIIRYHDYGVLTYGDVIATNERLIQEKPELVKKFMNALIRSMYWAINPDNSEDVIRLTMKWTPGTTEEAHRIEMPWWYQILESDNTRQHILGWMTAEPFAKMQDLMIENGLIDTEIDVREAFDNSILADIEDEVKQSQEYKAYVATTQNR